MTRPRRGTYREEQNGAERIGFSYRGLDGVTRRTTVRCDPAPESLTVSAAIFIQSLGPKEEKNFALSYACEIEGSTPIFVPSNYERSYSEAEGDLRNLQHQAAQVRTSNEQFNQWL